MRTDETLHDDFEGETAPLVLENVGKSFGKTTVLEDISFRLPANSVTAVIGPNGSGKSTLSRIVTGLSQPSTGEVTLQTTTERPVGYLPQDPQFRPVFTVEETIRFYSDLLTSSEDPMSIIKQVGLNDVSGRRIDALSGGMRRLVGIAQSFLGSPPVIVLDEPTSGLDPRMTEQIFDIVAARAEKGASVFLTTHDLNYATEADFLIVLHRGEIVAKGSPNQLLAQTESKSLSDAFLSLVGRKPTVQTGQLEATNE